MLQDMKNLQDLSNKISFQIGRPFTPFQQLLGCLPPLSSNLLPKPYQWLMTSNDSPVKSFYPLQFEVDQNGKKTPWEAVVLLDFIDETRLLEAETVYCPPNKLSTDERNRNLFGCVLSHVYDPSIVDSYPSPNPEIGLADILSCQSIVTKSTSGLAPTCFFKAQLLEGTVYPIAGFPSLTILPIVDFKKSFAKINMFGSDSKYKSVVIEIKAPSSTELKDINLESLLDRTVYVNYPQVHEAKVVAVTKYNNNK
jgi:5'-3' exoribonuclease 1